MSSRPTTVVEGQVEAGKRYTEADFNKIIEIKEREQKRVEIVMEQINQHEKTLVFCASQLHALAVRDHARVQINSQFSVKQRAFLDFVLQHYVTEGVGELEQSKLNPLLRLKYHDSITDAVADLGGKPDEIALAFAGFQKYLYQEQTAA